MWDGTGSSVTLNSFLADCSDDQGVTRSPEAASSSGRSLAIHCTTLDPRATRGHSSTDTNGQQWQTRCLQTLPAGDDWEMAEEN